ncbi:MAG TPA: glycosyltransferase, partial [Anaerolineales bacterium]|nr:glycosyltransferase [Anaerolineales bacterium]
IMGSSGSADSAAVASPMKMFEYMAAGRAIVSSDLPVIREVLNESNAVFCRPDDLGEWRLVIEALLDDDARRTALGNQARLDVQGYTWTARAQRILNGFP